jgi:hypothetical protein
MTREERRALDALAEIIESNWMGLKCQHLNHTKANDAWLHPYRVPCPVEAHIENALAAARALTKTASHANIDKRYRRGEKKRNGK